MLKLAKKLFSQEEKFYLKVPYEEKDIAKKLGARWDPKIKSWFITKKNNRESFAKWIPENVSSYSDVDADICSNGFYVVESFELCWKCQTLTPVFAFLLLEQHKTKEFDEEKDQIVWCKANYKCMIGGISLLNAAALTKIQSITSHYFLDDSKKASRKYYMNHCSHCGTKLGDFYMHMEPEGAFQPMTAEDASTIKLTWFDELFEANADYNSDVNYFEHMKII